METPNSAPKPKKIRNRLIAGVTAAALAGGGVAAYEATQNTKPAVSRLEVKPGETNPAILANFDGKAVPNVTNTFGPDVVVYDSTDPTNRHALEMPKIPSLEVLVGLPVTVNGSPQLGFEIGNHQEGWIDEKQTPPTGTVSNAGPEYFTLRIDNGQLIAINNPVDPSTKSTEPINTWGAVTN